MTIRIEKSGFVWTIIHSRPEARGAMDPEQANVLYEAFLAFNADDNAYVAVFWGEGGAFCSGWDLKYAASLDADDFVADYEFPDTDSHSIAAMGPSRLTLDKPVIAAIAGPAVAGGMELALLADMRVMEKSAYMGVFSRRWGIPLIDGGTVRLPRLVGEGRAMDIILTGRKLDAEECLRIGLCEYVVDNGKSRQKAEELAHKIASFPQSCLRTDRKSVLDQHSLDFNDALRREWENGKDEMAKDGIDGASRFAKGAGRHGKF